MTSRSHLAPIRRKAELEFHGAKQLELKDGSLVIQTEGGRFDWRLPGFIRRLADRSERWRASFVLRGANRAGFEIGSYDRSRELVIDPILNFSTYFGGSGDEHTTFVAVDGGFNIYLAGSTTSPNLAGSRHVSYHSERNGRKCLCRPDYATAGITGGRARLRDVCGRQRQRHAGGSEGRRRQRTLCCRNDHLDQFPYVQCLPDGSSERESTCVRDRVQERWDWFDVLVLSVGQWNGYGERHDDRRRWKPVRHRYDDFG